MTAAVSDAGQTVVVELASEAGRFVAYDAHVLRDVKFPFGYDLDVEMGAVGARLRLQIPQMTDVVAGINRSTFFREVFVVEVLVYE